METTRAIRSRRRSRWRPAGLLHRVLAERGTIFSRRGQRALGQVVADEVDGGDEGLGLHRQQAGRAGEVVGVGLRVDFDGAVVVDLGVEHVGAAAEVDDVEDVDVLAQLLLGELQALAQLGHVQAGAGAARVDEDRGERHQAGEALRADGGVAAVPVGAAPVPARRRPRRGRAGAGGAARRPPAWRSATRLTRSRTSTSRRAPDTGVLAQAHHPGGELAGRAVRVQHDGAVVTWRTVPKWPKWRSACQAMRGRSRSPPRPPRRRTASRREE